MLLVGHVRLGPALEGRTGREAIGEADAIDPRAVMDVVLKDVHERVANLRRRRELAAMMPIGPDLAPPAEEAIQPASERDRQPRDPAAEHVAVLRLQAMLRTLGDEPRMLRDLFCRGALRLDGEMKMVILDREVNDLEARAIVATRLVLQRSLQQILNQLGA